MPSKADKELIIEGLKLEKLISDFKLNEDTLAAVIRRELIDKGVTTSYVLNSGFAMYAMQAYEGYSLIISAYLAINSDSLSVQDSKKLEAALKILEILRQQNLDIYALKSVEYASYKDAQKTKVLEQLKNTGEVYMLGAFLLGSTISHHAILKYAKVGDHYTRTEFNEGLGVEKLPATEWTQRGWGVNQRKLKPENLKNAIGVDVDTLFSGASAGDKVTVLLEPRTKEDIEQSIITTLQVVGNCNTRSIRSLLRHVLGPKLLRGVYELATTQLPDIEIQLAEKLSEIQGELSIHGAKDKFKSSLRSQKSSLLAFEVSAKPGINLVAERREQLREAIKVQGERIFQNQFKEDGKELEGLLVKFLTNPKIESYAKSWPFLNPKSYTKIAFILAENLARHGAIYQNNENPPKIEVSLNVDAKEMINIMYKVIVTMNVPGNEVGNDLALTACAYDLVQSQKSLITDFQITNNEAKLIAAVKSMLVKLTSQYFIDSTMLKLVQKNLNEEITAALNNYALQDLLDKSEQIIKDTRAKLDKNITLKQSRKDNAPKPAARAVPGKLNMQKYKKDIGNLFAQKEITKINKALNRGAQLTPQYLYEAALFAIEFGSKQLCERLLKGNFKIDVNTRDESGQTLLMKAAQVGNAEVMPILIAAGADATLKDASGRSALIHALEVRNLDALVKLIENTSRNVLKEQIEEPGENGVYFLRLLVETENPDLIKGTLQAFKKHPNLFKSLIEQNFYNVIEHPWDAAKRARKTVNVDYNILQWAVREGQVHIAKIVLDCVSDMPQLLNKSVKRKFEDYDHNTILHKAVKNSSKDMEMVILESIKDQTGILYDLINAKDDHGKTPLHWAVENKKGIEIAHILLRYGAAPDLMMLTNPVLSSEFRKDLCLKYVTSFAPSTSFHEGISEILPDAVKRMLPAIFPPGRDDKHQR